MSELDQVIAMHAERARLLPALQAIFMAYDRAQEDAGAKLPSPLMAAIVAARSVVGRLLQEKGSLGR